MSDRPDIAGWETDPEEPHYWINRAFPWWRAWCGVTGDLFYARRPRTSPPAVVRAPCLAGLGAEIIRRERHGAGPRGNSNPSGLNVMAGRDGTTGEPLAPNHWWWLV